MSRKTVKKFRYRRLTHSQKLSIKKRERERKKRKEKEQEQQDFQVASRIRDAIRRGKTKVTVLLPRLFILEGDAIEYVDRVANLSRIMNLQDFQVEMIDLREAEITFNYIY